MVIHQFSSEMFKTKNDIPETTRSHMDVGLT